MSKLTNYPSKEVKEFGEHLSDYLYTASIQKSMIGLGGCKSFAIHDFPKQFHKYIEAYVDGSNRDSVAIIYAAMKDKEQSLVQ